MPTQRYHVLIPVNCKCYLIRKKGLSRCDYIKDSEMRTLSWIIQVSPKCSHKGPYKRKADTHRNGGGHVAMEPKTEVGMWP